MNMMTFTVDRFTISVQDNMLCTLLLPARASEQGNVIGLVSVYICIYILVYKKIEIEQTRDLIYLRFVVTDFFPIISPSTGENSGDSA